MANNPELLKMPLARDGQKSTIPETTDASTGLFSQQYGWQSINSLPPQAGGKAVKREDFNGAFNLLGGIAYYAQKGFTFKWSADQDYYAGCVVIDDTDGLRYECIADVTANNTAPSADATHWQIFSAGTDIDAWFRQASTVYAVGDMRCYDSLPYGWYLDCTTAGTTGSGDITIPSPLNVGDTVTDGAVVWTIRKSANTADLSEYAPLASPTFTGTPKAPTPTSTDNSTRIATTAFVKSNIPSMSGYANTSLSNLSASGKKFFFPSSTYIDISSYVNTSQSGTTTYTAPDNGYVTLSVTRSSSTSSNLSCGVKNNTSGIENKTSQQLVSGTLGSWVPCRKGDVISLMSVGSSTRVAKFVYIGG